jgi:hypothetical protein
MWPCLISAQLDLSASWQQGYVHNIFKNPSSWTPAGSTTLSPDELLQSSFITELALDGDWKRKWKQQQLQLDGRLTTQLSPVLSSANLLDLVLRQSYEYRLSKRLRVYQAANIRSKSRQGNEVAEELFVLPNSYRQLEYRGGIRWSVNAQHLLKLEAGRLSKAYQATDTAELSYRATTARLYHRYRFRDRIYLQRWSNTFKYQNRWYESVRFSEEEEGEEETFEEFEDIRTWQMQYLRLQSTLKYILSDAWAISPSLETTHRGSPNARLRYWQIKPAVKVEFEQGRWQGSLRTSFTYRKNPFLLPGNSHAPLVYRYLGLTTHLAYSWKKGWSCTLSGSATKRWSNFADVSSRLNRAYQQGELLLGFRRAF